MKRLALVMLTLLATTLASTGFSASKDVDWERLSRSLAQLSAEPNLGRLAAPEIERAQAALLHLKENGKGKKRAHLLYLAERRVDIAWARAQLVDLERQQTELAREHDRLLIAAARHDAEQARLELDRLRLQGYALPLVNGGGTGRSRSGQAPGRGAGAGDCPCAQGGRTGGSGRGCLARSSEQPACHTRGARYADDAGGCCLRIRAIAVASGSA